MHRSFFLLAACALACAALPARACHWCSSHVGLPAPAFAALPSYHYRAAPLAYAQPSYLEAQPLALAPAAVPAQILWLSATPAAQPSAPVAPAQPIDAAALKKLTADLETLTRAVNGLTATADDHEARLRRLEAWAKDAKQPVPLPK
jgi:hypothetical protein